MDFMQVVNAMTGNIVKYPIEIFCKDTLILKCKISCVSDIIVEDVTQIENTFINVTNIAMILNKRCAVINKYGIFEHLKEVGIKSKLDLLRVTHGVSLTDCLWVRFEGETISWKHVNPYEGNYVFDINWFIESKDPILRLVLPNYSTDGQFAKCWKSNSYVHYLIKTGSSGAYNAGIEPLSEILFTQIAKEVGYTNHVEYKPYFIDYTGTNYNYKQPSLLKDTIGPNNKRLATECKVFTNEVSSLITARELGLTAYEDCIRFAKEFTTNSSELIYMLMCDCIGFNTDRHMGNIGFLYNPDNMQIYKVAPMYDNNMSMLCYWDDREDIKEYALSLRAKDGSDFPDLAKMLIHECSWIKSYIKNADFYVGHNLIINDRSNKLTDVIRANVKRLII